MADREAKFLHYLDRRTLSERVRDHTKEGYLLTYSVMKGVALANAAYTLGLMIRDGTSWSAYILWCASLFALLVSHSTTMTGILLATSRRNPLDSVIPFALSIAEFLLFSPLQPIPGGPLVTWWSWHLAYGSWSLIAALLIFNRLSQTKISDVDPDDRPLIALMLSFKRSLRRNLFAAGIPGGIWLVFGLLTPMFPLWVHGLLGGFVLVTMGGVLIKNEVDHRSILAVVAGERDAICAAPGR